jgi:hypothetical protein
VRVGERLGQRAAGQEPLGRQTVLHPAEERLDDRPCVIEPVLALGVPLEFGLPDLRFERVEGADGLERLGRQRGLGRFGVDELASAVRPALRVGEPGLAGIGFVGAIAIGEQHAAFDRAEPEHLLDIAVCAALEEGEADLVEFAIDRPEVAALHLARAGAAGLDRGLVHGLDAAGADRGQLGRVDRLEQRGGLRGQLGEPGAADRDAGVQEALVLAVQRQVPGELIKQQTDEEAHVGAAPVDHARRRRRAVERLRVAALDQRAHVLEDHVAARALGQAVADLLPDHLVLVRREPLDIRVGHGDGLDRYAGFVEEQRSVVLVVGEVAAWRTPRVAGHRLVVGLGRLRKGELAQVHLRRVRGKRALLALLAEELATEPLELVLDGLYFALQRRVRPGQFDDPLGRPLGGFGGGRNGGGVWVRHGPYFTAEPSIHAGFEAFSGRLKRRL